MSTQALSAAPGAAALGTLARAVARPFAAGEASALLRLAAPLTAVAFVNMGMSLTDVVLMGRIGADAVAAGAVVSDVYSLVYYFCAGVLAAVTVEVARAVGAGRSHGVRAAAQQGMWLALLLAAFACAVLWHTPAYLVWIGIEPRVAELGVGYARTMALTAMPMMGVALWRGVHPALGRPRAFLIATLIALPANAVLDVWFMFGGLGLAPMGLTGAGLASLVVAWGMCAGLCVYTHLRPSLGAYRLLTRVAPPDPRRLAALLRLGAPIGVAGFAEVGVFLLSTLVAALFGAAALAAHAIALRLAGVVYALPVGLSQAATVRVGMALGRGDAAAANATGRAALLLGALAGAGLCAGLAVGAADLPWLFLTPGDAGAAAVAQSAALLLGLLGLVSLAQGVGVVGAGVLRGAKDTRAPMAMGLIGFWGVGAAVIALAAFGADWREAGVWTGIAAGAAATALMIGWRLARHFGGGGRPAETRDLKAA